MRQQHETAQESGEVTRLLKRWTQGDPSAIDALWPLVWAIARVGSRREPEAR